MISGLLINSSSVGGNQIRLANGQYLRARNAANTADINVLQVTGTNLIEFALVPQVSGSGALALQTDVNDAIAELVGLTDEIDLLSDAVSSLQTQFAFLQVNFETAVADIDALEVLQASYLLLDGTRPMTAILNMGTHKISNVTNPTLAQDAATKSYVDASIPAISTPAKESYTIPAPVVVDENIILSNTPVSESMLSYVQGNPSLILTEGDDYTISGSTVTLLSASPIIASLVGGEKIKFQFLY